MFGPIDREKVLACDRINVKALAYEARQNADLYLINRTLLDDIRRAYKHGTIDYPQMLSLVRDIKAGKADKADADFKALVRIGG